MTPEPPKKKPKHRTANREGGKPSASTYTVLHEDATLLVVDKAAGVLTVGHDGSERCLLDDLRRDGFAVAPVHRLDRETSGVLLLCLDKRQRPALEELFKQHRVTKEYLALVEGVPRPDRATIAVPIKDLGKTVRVERGGRRAVTHYTVERKLDRAALVRLDIETGRHNQIRVHLAHIGHPVLGDRKFGRRPKAGSDGSGPRARRALLHAARLTFEHPVSGKALRIEAPLPDDMQAVLDARGSRR